MPPKYKPADFRAVSYWSQRGKLDVPKERFVSYPGASPRRRPHACCSAGPAGTTRTRRRRWSTWSTTAATQAGWDDARVTPLLAGLAEVLPWVHQWHGEYDDEWGGNPAEEYQAYLDEQRLRRGLTDEALRAWRPAPATRGRRPRATT